MRDDQACQEPSEDRVNPYARKYDETVSTGQGTGDIPMMSVKNEEVNTMRKITLINNAEGCPVSSEPVFLANQWNAYLTGKSMKKTHATPVNRTYRALRPLVALTRATVRARRTHPMTSLPTPAERTVTPTLF